MKRLERIKRAIADIWPYFVGAALGVLMVWLMEVLR